MATEQDVLAEAGVWQGGGRSWPAPVPGWDRGWRVS